MGCANRRFLFSVLVWEGLNLFRLNWNLFNNKYFFFFIKSQYLLYTSSRI